MRSLQQVERLAAFSAALFLATTALGQTTSGPTAGAKIPKLKVYAATGDDAGKQLDFAAGRKEKTTVYVFVQADKWDRPVARFVRELDKEIAKEDPDAKAVAVWLTGDQAKAKEYLPKAQMSLKLSNTTWAVFEGDKAGPADWAVNSDAHLTAVVAAGGKVKKSFGYRSVNETDVPDVIKALKK